MPTERRAAILEQIEACQVQLFLACGVEEARAVLGTRRVDLIFTDCQLPDGNWRDIVAHRAQAGFHSEVILCARRLEAKLCAEAFTRGVWDVIADASSREELRRTIESAASRMYMHSLGGARGAACAAS
ncbi:MAG TPA: hypothetical protein VHA11_08640 [Bryobacteraceae bacterium]|nr:hypothetical protein [Bryobacteraceae bacterium]